MATTPADEAKRLARLGDNKRNAARYTKNSSKKQTFLEDAAKKYEDTGKNWLKEAAQNLNYPRRVDSAKGNASYYYGLAKRIREGIHKEKSLEGQVFGIASIISFLGALFFLSFNLTGNSIGNFTNEDLSLYWAGIGMTILGLVFAFVFLKLRKK